MRFFNIHKNMFLVIIAILISLPFVTFFGINGDEAFTMGMIKLSYSGIINATSLDIHPPLYYILLKSFLNITTFWTNNIFIKVIASRILSSIFSILSFYFLIKILHITNKKYNQYLYFLIYILLPLELGWEQQFANIRMYSLCILLFSIEVYFVIKYLIHPRKINLIIVTVSNVMSMYTNYICGLISGTFLIILFIDKIFHKKFYQSWSIFISGFLSIIAFLPWIPYLLKQISLTKYDTIMTFHSMIKFFIVVVGIIFIFMIPKFLKHNDIKISPFEKKITQYLYITMTITIIVIVIIKPNAISLRYVAPIITLIMFIESPYYVNSKYLYTNKKNKIFLTTIFSLFLIGNFTISLEEQIKNLSIPSYHYLASFKKVENSNKKNINAQEYGLTKYPWDNMGGNAIYLQSINKRISDKHYINMYNSLGNGNQKLFKTIFYNVNDPYRKHF